jgi:hypothetical protein
MDMKKILQAFDGTANKPVQGSNDMKKFMSIVTEGTNRQTVAEQMIVQEYSKPVAKKGNGVINKYIDAVLKESEEKLLEKKARAAVTAKRVLARMEESKQKEAPKPRNFVAKNAKTAGAGAHKDKKKAEKQGDVKHKGKALDIAEVSLGDYRKKAKMSKAGHEMDYAFDRPENKPMHKHKIAQRTAGLTRAEKRIKPMSKPSSEPVDSEALQARLADLERQFDPHYEYSDDHSVWSKHNAIRQQIQSIKRQLRDANESMVEGDEDPCWANYKMVGTKKKGGKTVPNCVPKKKG